MIINPIILGRSKTLWIADETSNLTHFDCSTAELCTLYLSHWNFSISYLLMTHCRGHNQQIKHHR